ncbi:MAG TPA: RidA family protein [Pseudonocardiaceae bacterium]|jgi:enamine deaminase RidA (YjgF/YER057c/UK114 family)|nr:RidA family protein [Pseudonocardiaceae bacterium]
MKIYVNPDTLPHNPAFTQAIVVEAPSKTIYVGGQNGITADGSLAGDTLADQARQALRNVESVLTAAGAKLTDIVRWTIAIVEGHPLADGFAAFREAWGDHGDPPTIGVHVVSGLANPRFLVEIDAIAAV